MSSSHENIYYLDPWFLAREYEMRTNSSLPSKIHKASNGGLEGSVGIFKGRTGSQETLEFNQTPEKAFWEISQHLDEFPEITLTPNISLPSVFWIRGILTLHGEKHTRQENGKPETLIDDVWAFCILGPEKAYTDPSIRLLTDSTHFRYNLNQLLSHPTTLGSHFRPSVRALLKSYGDLNDEGLYLATPLVILETRE